MDLSGSSDPASRSGILDGRNATSTTQYVYLDFDGEETRYRNRDLGLDFAVSVEDSGFSEEEQKQILSALMSKYADAGIVFTLDKPTDGASEYSTVFIGKSDDIKEYGSFEGLAETVDCDNRMKNDNAFVFLDRTDGMDKVISVADHELGHIVLGQMHDTKSDSLNDYASVVSRQTTTLKVNVSRSGGQYPGYAYAETKYWSPSMPSGASYAYVTITNQGETSRTRYDSVYTNIIVKYNGSSYSLNPGNSKTFTVYSNSTFAITRDAYVDLEAAYPINDLVYVGGAVGYKYVFRGYYYYTGSSTNTVSISVEYCSTAPINYTPPKAPTVKASTTALTNKNVTVTATFGKDSAKKQYSTDNSTWRNYTAALSVSANGTYYFRGVNSSGYASKVVSIRISNIDKTPPATPTVKASTTKPTNKNVAVTAAFSKDSAKKQYSTDKKSWKNYSKAITVKSNATYYFRALDKAGNVSKVASLKVANIDKVAPKAPTVKASTTKPTNKNVTVTAAFSKDSAKKQYSTDKKSWKTYSNVLSVGKNATYYFRGIDAAGNISKIASIKVANIDKVAPKAPTVKLNSTKVTNKNITVTVKYSSDSRTKQYSTDSKTWKSCSGKLTVSSNGTYYFRGIDAAGNVSKIASIKVGNIDKTAPVAPTVKLSSTDTAKKTVTIAATYSGDCAKKQYSTDNKNWKTYSKAITVKSSATYYFRGIDAAGNVSKVTSAKVSPLMNIANNSWQGATELTGTANGALDTKLDTVDYYNIGDVAKLMLDMEAGKAKVTFCDGGKKAVSTTVRCADGSEKTLSSLTLVSGDKVNDKITFSAIGDAIKYLKIENAGTYAAYKLAKLA